MQDQQGHVIPQLGASPSKTLHWKILNAVGLRKRSYRHVHITGCDLEEIACISTGPMPKKEEVREGLPFEKWCAQLASST